MDNGRSFEPSDALGDLYDALTVMRALNAEDQWRDRRLSLAITEAEMAFLWARTAFEGKGADVSDWSVE